MINPRYRWIEDIEFAVLVVSVLFFFAYSKFMEHKFRTGKWRSSFTRRQHMLDMLIPIVFTIELVVIAITFIILILIS